MKIYLMQHGLSLPREQDPDQGLSDEGREGVINSANALTILGISVDVMVASPKKRSRQTAEIIAKALRFPVDNIQETETIKPMAPPEEAVAFLQQFNTAECVFLAGHLPSLRRLSAYWLGMSDDAWVEFRNGGCCCIELDDLTSRDGQLVWSIQPDQLARVR